MITEAEKPDAGSFKVMIAGEVVDQSRDSLNPRKPCGRISDGLITSSLVLL
jgi:hypothetical protein